MLIRIALCLVMFVSLAAAQAPPPSWDDNPGVNFDPQSTDAAPCGIGTPPRGHFPVEISAATAAKGVDLTVRQDLHRLCYVGNGIAEAPVIRVRRGQELDITLKNEISDPSAIDRVVSGQTRTEPVERVPATAGYLPVVPGHRHVPTGATNLHVHGFAVPPVSPQDEVMKTCADAPGGPSVCGRQAVTYRYQIPADMPAGLYWYHPHVHGEVQAQMVMGLSGAIVVEGPDDDVRRAHGIEDRIFIIRQAQDTDVRQPLPPLPMPGLAPPPKLPREPHPAPDAGGTAVDTDHELACSAFTGIDRISLNGAKVAEGRPKDADLAPVEIPAGTVQLWRILNAATDAFLDLAIVGQDGMPVPLRIVARDGAPVTDDAGKRLDTTSTDYQLVPPAGRLEVLVAAPPPGQKSYLISKRVDTGCTGDKVPERKLALLTAGPEAAGATDTATTEAAFAALPPTAPDRFAGLLSRPTETERRMVMAEYPRPGIDDQNDFYIAEMKPGAILKPFTMGDPPTVVTHVGAVEEWVIENWTNELHAFHIHQVHFRVLEINDRHLDAPPLVDTVNVPFSSVPDVTDSSAPPMPGRVRIKLEFPAALAGDILFHCHLVDHEDAGMMGMVRVLPTSRPPGAQKADLLDQGAFEVSADNPSICRRQPAPGDRHPEALP